MVVGSGRLDQVLLINPLTRHPLLTSIRLALTEQETQSRLGRTNLREGYLREHPRGGVDSSLFKHVGLNLTEPL